MINKKIMIIGGSKSGKTTLANLLEGACTPAKKCQDLIYGKYTIDIPGAY